MNSQQKRWFLFLKTQQEGGCHNVQGDYCSEGCCRSGKPYRGLPGFCPKGARNGEGRWVLCAGCLRGLLDIRNHAWNQGHDEFRRRPDLRQRGRAGEKRRITRHPRTLSLEGD